MRIKIRNIASSLGNELAMGGTHPFHRSGTGVAFPAERYERILVISAQRLLEEKPLLWKLGVNLSGLEAAIQKGRLIMSIIFKSLKMAIW